ncbi:hypothetical protein E2C01_064551 [Portunus trituberculatus]|uniref:Uncharacterized protein n=1 Tax=Portunus trituberculatus TaxID=210409 RepID=A0A5B7HNN2_PORTR|nr:hypothetical protein [Portunus trituberculatus]
MGAGGGEVGRPVSDQRFHQRHSRWRRLEVLVALSKHSLRLTPSLAFLYSRNHSWRLRSSGVQAAAGSQARREADVRGGHYTQEEKREAI